MKATENIPTIEQLKALAEAAHDFKERCNEIGVRTCYDEALGPEFLVYNCSEEDMRNVLKHTEYTMSHDVCSDGTAFINNFTVNGVTFRTVDRD